MVKIADVLTNKGIIVMHGDRYTDDTSTIAAKPWRNAKFPSGPYHFKLSKFGVPNYVLQQLSGKETSIIIFMQCCP